MFLVRTVVVFFWLRVLSARFSALCRDGRCPSLFLSLWGLLPRGCPLVSCLSRCVQADYCLCNHAPAKGGGGAEGGGVGVRGDPPICVSGRIFFFFFFCIRGLERGGRVGGWRDRSVPSGRRSDSSAAPWEGSGVRVTAFASPPLTPLPSQVWIDA